MLTNKEKKLLVKWFKAALGNVAENNPLTERQALHGSCGRGPIKVAFMVTTSANHLRAIDDALPPVSHVTHHWLAKEEVE